MRTSAEVEAEVEASRSELDRNVEALKQKMTPGQLFDEASRLMGGTGQQVASRFAEQAKANPMPLAVMGLGLAWLMASNNKSPTTSYGYAEPRSFADEGGVGLYETGGGATSGSGGGIKEKVQGVLSTAKDKVANAKDKVSSAGASAAQSGRSAGQNLSSMGRSAGQNLSSAAGQVRNKAGQVGQQAQQTFTDTLEREPLLIAGLGVIVGAAIGAALPNTRAEHRMMGEHRERLLGKGKELAQSGMEKAGAAAQATYGAVKTELKNGDSARPTEDRLADAARSGVQAAQEHLQPPTH